MTPTSKLSGRVRKWFTGLAGAGLVYLHFSLAPVPASRPRVTRWGVYYGKTYAAWRKEAEGIVSGFPDCNFDGPLACLVECVVAPPKTVSRTHPRYDLDNYAKGPLDATNNSDVWTDDEQIVFLAVTKRFTEGDEEPATHLYLFPIQEDTK